VVAIREAAARLRERSVLGGGRGDGWRQSDGGSSLIDNLGGDAS
jgi:hypothetical protein